MDILPSDDILQKYMYQLGGGSVDVHVVQEIKEYEKRIAKRIDNGDTSLMNAVRYYNEAEYMGEYIYICDATYSEKPPFPLLDMYAEVVCSLKDFLERKESLFIFGLVSELGNKVHSREKDEEEEVWVNNFALDCILKDRRFMKLASTLKKDFDQGCKQFSSKPDFCAV